MFVNFNFEIIGLWRLPNLVRSPKCLSLSPIPGPSLNIEICIVFNYHYSKPPPRDKINGFILLRFQWYFIANHPTKCVCVCLRSML